MSGIAITIPELLDQEYKVEVYQTWSISVPEIFFETASGGEGLSFTLPDFQRDIAFKVYPKPAKVGCWLTH